MSNTELQNIIEGRLDADEALRAADLDVDADASANRVTISGTVPSEAMRTRAIELAQSAHPGVSVESEIDVKPSEVAREDWTEEHARDASTRAKQSGDTVGSSLDDTWIHTKIVAQLVGDTDTAARKINVDVKDNVVTLRGTVSSDQEKNEAARIARETQGVVRVVNQLKVAPSSAS
jgi:osmotically-inducible protein OsmY